MVTADARVANVVAQRYRQQRDDPPARALDLPRARDQVGDRRELSDRRRAVGVIGRPGAGGGQGPNALRGIEDCYTLNPKAPKSAIFAGWKDMDVYMRENKIDGAPSMLGKADKPARAPRSDASDTSDADRS